YPMAMSSTGPEANFGVTAGIDYLFGVTSKPSSGPGTYTTAARTWSLGVKYRMDPLFFTLAYGDQVFQLNPSGGAAILVPAVDYRFVRVGAGVRMEISDGVFIMGSAAYLHVLSFGQIAAVGFYPRTTTGGAGEATVGLGYRITPMIELRAMGEVRAYAMKFNVTPAMLTFDPTIRVAGGARDLYAAGWIGLAITYGGGGGGTHATAKPSEGEDEDEEGEAPKAKKKDKDEDKDEDEDA
ncbi:MAG: hypothetical protein ABUS79_32160, partial [Pseudomonadota bacterium]